MTALKCDQSRDCDDPVAWIDDKGWIYCAAHGRRDRPSRLITVAELVELEAGRPIPLGPPVRPPEEHDEERRRDVRGWVLVDAAARRSAVRLTDGRFVRLIGAPTPHRLDRKGRPIGGGSKAKVLHGGRYEMVDASSIAHIYGPGALVPTS